jgi:hypothetical protein
MQRRARSRRRGQTAVEAALTLPLTLFMVLGALQLFLMLQARLMTEHAAYRAARAGSLSQGSCRRMLHATIATLLPTFARTDSPTLLADAFQARQGNRYQPGLDSGHDGEIVWLLRPSPQRADIPGPDDAAFDDPDREALRLEVRLIFWYPMRIPFANWVIARMSLAWWGLQTYSAANPLMMAQNARWGAGPSSPPALVAGALAARTNSPAGTYVFPVQATSAMRMMTPARREFFTPQDCR